MLLACECWRNDGSLELKYHFNNCTALIVHGETFESELLHLFKQLPVKGGVASE